MSLAGPENDDENLRPYLEDIVVIAEELLRSAQLGRPLPVRHLVSAHGPYNFQQSPDILLRFSPASTLVPLASYLDGTY